MIDLARLKKVKKLFKFLMELF